MPNPYLISYDRQLNITISYKIPTLAIYFVQIHFTPSYTYITSLPPKLHRNRKLLVTKVSILVSMATTIFLQKSSFLATKTLGRYTHQAANQHPVPLLVISKVRHNCFPVPKQDLSVQKGNKRKMNVAVHSTAPGAPVPSTPSPGPWKGWIIGAIVTIILSFSKGKWGPLLKLKEKFETTIDAAEHVADIVEEVAEKVDEIAEEAAKHIPDGKLHDAVEFVEKVAEEIDKGAEVAEAALEKVEGMEKEVASIFESATEDQENTAVPVSVEAEEKK